MSKAPKRPATPLPDAEPTNWVDRLAPPRLRPWLRLGRFDRPTGIWLLMLPGWQGVAFADAMHRRPPDPVLLILFFVGATLMRAAGCAYNDIVDADIDAKVARTARRPIPAGEISVKGAWIFLLACSLASAVILFSFNFLSITLGIGSLLLVSIYPYMKRVTWWPQAWLGLTFNWGVLLGYAAALRLPTLVDIVTGAARTHSYETLYAVPILLLYLSGVFWTLGYDTIYAVQDLEDDALAGVKSSARRLGPATGWGVFAFYVIGIGLAGGAAWFGRLRPAFWPILGLYALSLLRQPLRLRRADAAGALRLFKFNTLSGLLLFLAIVASGWTRLTSALGLG